jgi:hypothetical protein
MIKPAVVVAGSLLLALLTGCGTQGGQATTASSRHAAKSLPVTGRGSAKS